MKFASVCFILLSVCVLLCEGQRLGGGQSSCEKPPSGPWLVSESRPAEDGTTEGRSVLILTEDDEVTNAYSGHGTTVYYTDSGMAVPTGELETYSAALMFDAATCVMTGTIYNLGEKESRFADAVQWRYDGEKFTGIAARTEGIADSDVRLLVPPFANYELTLVA